MYQFLSPDKNNVLLKKYHFSNKLLIPLFIPSLLLPKSNGKKIIDSLNTIHIGFHSYVSVSCIISDYIKPTFLQKTARIINVKSHTIASIGLLYYIFKNK